MPETLTVLLAALGVVAAILAVLVPVAMQQSRSLRREFTLQTDNLAAALTETRRDLTARMDAMTARMDALTARVDALTARVDSVAERVARIEGALTGPWRPPANGNPPPVPARSTEP